jgi:hypothetical protein
MWMRGTDGIRSGLGPAHEQKAEFEQERRSGQVDRALSELQCPELVVGYEELHIAQTELSSAMADYIENFYNSERRHRSLNYLTPDEFEVLYLTPSQATLA